jgi:hypothetical protein
MMRKRKRKQNSVTRKEKRVLDEIDELKKKKKQSLQKDVDAPTVSADEVSS